MLNKGTASLEVKNSERNRELENFVSLEPQVCEVLLYFQYTLFSVMRPFSGERITRGRPSQNLGWPHIWMTKLETVAMLGDGMTTI